MVKKLRYYARFIVVCLLLRRVGAIRELLAVSIIICVIIEYKKNKYVFDFYH